MIPLHNITPVSLLLLGMGTITILLGMSTNTTNKSVTICWRITIRDSPSVHNTSHYLIRNKIE